MSENHLHLLPLEKSIIRIAGDQHHISELQKLEGMLYSKFDLNKLYDELIEFLEKEFPEKTASQVTIKDLERIDSFIRERTLSKMTVAEQYIVRSYVIGHIIEERQRILTPKLILPRKIEITKLPETIKAAAKELMLSTRQVETLNATISHTAQHLVSATNTTINRVQSLLTDNIIKREPRKDLVKKLREEFMDNSQEINRNWNRVCFLSGTIVLTESGRKPIEEVKIGEKVMTKKTKFRRKVTQLHKNKYTGDLYTLRTSTGKAITATPEHPVLISRNEKLQWVKICEIVKGDMICSLNGYDTYYNPEWLKQKHCIEKLDCKQISLITKTHPQLIRDNLKLFGIKVSSSFAVKARRTPKEITSQRTSQTAKRKNYAQRLTTKEARNKSKATMKQKYASGLEVWNKGKTAKTDTRIWSAKSSKRDYTKLHQRYADGNINPTASSWGRSGYMTNPFTQKIEYYRSSYEKIFMEKRIKDNKYFTSAHGIMIPYVDEMGISRNYIPDFLTATSIVETKASWQIIKNHQHAVQKIETAKRFCEARGLQFIVLTEKELFQ